MRARHSPLWSLLLLALGWLCVAQGSPPAAAGPGDGRVPLLGTADLPTAGTGAAMQRTNVTHVMVGDLGYFRLAHQVQRVISKTELQRQLAARVGTQRPSSHEVWITARGDYIWAHVRVIRLVCQDVGIYRVGLRIRHETTGTSVGFPLFLPAGDKARRPGRASRLPLALDAMEQGKSSDPRILYQVVKTARTRFKQDVVAEIRIHNNVPIQTVLTSLDMLHRAGCAGVIVKSLRNVPTTTAAPASAIRIVRFPRAKDAVLPPKPLKPIVLPPVQPRATPWPLHGANQPGAVNMELEELPIRGEDRPRVVEDPTRPLPFHMRTGRVPAEDVRLADQRVRAWAERLGDELLAGLRRDGRIAKQMVVRLRKLRQLSGVMTPVARAFPDAKGIRVRTLKVDVLLSSNGVPTGMVEVDLLLTTDQLSVISMRSIPGEIPAGVNLPPEVVDPYAAGTPGRLRVYLEGAFLAAKRGGSRAVAFARDAEVLAGCPAARANAVRQALTARRSEVARAMQTLSRAPFDRLYLTARGGTALVTGPAGTLGELEIGFEAEEGMLRINQLTARRRR